MALPGSRKAILGMRRGVGLIEMILVIGIIATLSSIAILSINPQKQILAARDSQRKSAAQQLQNAFMQGAINSISFTLPTSLGTSKAICKQGITTIVSCLNIDALVPIIIAAIPQDTVEPCPNYSGYRVYKSSQFINVFPMQLGRTSKNAYLDPECYDSGGAPEIALELTVDGGGTTALVTGQTFYPGVLSVGSHQFVFTIRNTGTGPMSLPSSPSLSGNAAYSVGAFTTGSLAASGTRQFTVTLNAGAAGDYATTVNLANDDANENPFTVTIDASVTPEMPSGLTAWLNASLRSTVLNEQGSPATDGETVATWKTTDSITLLNQSIIDQRPTLSVNGAGGKPTLIFNGKNTTLVSNKVTYFADSENDFTIFVVSQPDNKQDASADLFDYSHGSDVNFAMEQDPAAGTLPAFTLDYKSAHWESIGPQPSPSSSLQGIFYQKSGKNIVMHVNGATVYSGNAGSNFITAEAAFAVGGAIDGTQNFRGNISEILIFKRALSAAEVTSVEQYLQTKYGY